MKQILIPISFSQSSANSLQHADFLFAKSELTLLHCFSPYAYNQSHDFGNRSYEEGIKGLLSDFYKSNLPNSTQTTKLITTSGNVSETIAKISNQFDLMVMSKHKPKEKNGYWFGEKVLYLASKGHCPVLLLPESKHFFDFTSCQNIWHIKRKENETEILKENLPKLELDPNIVEVKLLEQNSFKSSFWRAILSYVKTHDENLLKEIAETHDQNKIDLIVLVSHGKDTFQKFMKAEVIQIINQYNIPILVFQANRLQKSSSKI